MDWIREGNWCDYAFSSFDKKSCSRIGNKLRHSIEIIEKFSIEIWGWDSSMVLCDWLLFTFEKKMIVHHLIRLRTKTEKKSWEKNIDWILHDTTKERIVLLNDVENDSHKDWKIIGSNRNPIELVSLLILNLFREPFQILQIN